uniref:Testicular haploid expressed gene protein n=1 Tax=Vombatus ursinus TaxID=29139 RepID=A0A4X2KWV1_VOMUR
TTRRTQEDLQTTRTQQHNRGCGGGSNFSARRRKHQQHRRALADDLGTASVWSLSLLDPRNLRPYSHPRQGDKGPEVLRDWPEYHNSWGQGSIIWKLPTKSFFSYPSPRIESLAEPKQLQEEYLQKRPYSSPEWHVKDPSLIPEASVRIVRLSVAKSTHPDFVAPKQVETQITPAALHAHPSLRVISLSEPKVKTETLYFERGRNDLPIRPVSTAAMTAQPSLRTLFLAKAKTVHSDYLPVHPVQQPVSRAALKYIPSPRIEVLSTPNLRTPLSVNAINLDAFKVKDAAKVAVCSPRIVKLAEPIKR